MKPITREIRQFMVDFLDMDEKEGFTWHYGLGLLVKGVYYAGVIALVYLVIQGIAASGPTNPNVTYEATYPF